MSKGCRGAKRTSQGLPVPAIPPQCGNCCEDPSGPRMAVCCGSQHSAPTATTRLKSACAPGCCSGKSPHPDELRCTMSSATLMSQWVGQLIDSILIWGNANPPALRLVAMGGHPKASRQVVAKSLVGDYRAEHLFCLQQALESYTHSSESDCRLRRAIIVSKCSRASIPRAMRGRLPPQIQSPRQSARLRCSLRMQPNPGVDLTAMSRNERPRRAQLLPAKVARKSTRFFLPQSNFGLLAWGFAADNRMQRGQDSLSKTARALRPRQCLAHGRNHFNIAVPTRLG